ncbi:MAG: beta-ureidopropionase [Truepera sp.]|nr:beta-ureidopropionase [Truepera sp.]
MIRHALLQFKPSKGRLTATLKRLAERLAPLKDQGIKVVTLPETALSGYFLQAGVREQALTAEQVVTLLQELLAGLKWTAPIDICLGFYERYQDDFFNSALYAEFNTPQAGIRHIHRKLFLPTYGVFDEERYVSRGQRLDTFATRFGRAGMLICEDAWHSSTAAVLALKEAEVLYIPMASPARDLVGAAPANARRWLATAEGIAAEHGIFVITTSLVGFEGGKGMVGFSHAVNPYGQVIAQGPLFEEAVVLVDLHLESIQVARYETPLLADLRANLAPLIRSFQEAL